MSDQVREDQLTKLSASLPPVGDDTQSWNLTEAQVLHIYERGKGAGLLEGLELSFDTIDAIREDLHDAIVVRVLLKDFEKKIKAAREALDEAVSRK